MNEPRTCKICGIESCYMPSDGICWDCHGDIDAMENDPEWQYEDFGDAPMYDMYPLELDDGPTYDGPPREDNREYDPEDYEE